MFGEIIVFFPAAALALAAAIGVVFFKNPFYSVLSLVTHLFALAILFLLLDAQFVAAAQVVIYIGAVMVLYVFVAAYIGGKDEAVGTRSPVLRTIGAAVLIGLLVEFSIAITGSGLSLVDSQGADVSAGFGTPAQIGELFLTKFLLVFEVASLLLLIAAVGAIVLARHQRGVDAGSGY